MDRSRGQHRSDLGIENEWGRPEDNHLEADREEPGTFGKLALPGSATSCHSGVHRAPAKHPIPEAP